MIKVAIDAGAIPIFVSLLHSPLDSIRKEAAWSLSNVLAGGAEQIQYVIVANGITKLIDLLMRGDFKTRTEVLLSLFLKFIRLYYLCSLAGSLGIDKCGVQRI